MRGMWKLILNTFAVTLASVLVVATFIFLLLSFLSPAAMARFTGGLGMYAPSAWYNTMQYGEGTGDVDYIVDAVNTMYSIKKYDKVVKYGKLLMADERFEAYAAQKDEAERAQAPDRRGYEAYKQVVYGRIAIAHYFIGEKSEGLTLALSVNQTVFERNNAVTDLTFEVIMAGDKEFAKEVKTRLTSLSESGGVTDEEQAANVNDLLATLTNFIGA